MSEKNMIKKFSTVIYCCRLSWKESKTWGGETAYKKVVSFCFLADYLGPLIIFIHSSLSEHFTRSDERHVNIAPLISIVSSSNNGLIHHHLQPKKKYL